MTELTTQKAIQHLLVTGYSKYRLAKMLGVQPIMLRFYERGESRMSSAVAFKLKQLFSIVVTDVYTKREPS